MTKRLQEMSGKMSIEKTIQEQIDAKRKELNEAAGRDLSSEECFQRSIELDALLERYYAETGANWPPNQKLTKN